MRLRRLKFLQLVPFAVMYVGLFRNLPAIYAAPEMLTVGTGGNSDNGIEHQVTAEEAKLAAKDIEPDQMIGAGCKSCNRREIEYCLSSDVISDHCCCDKKFRETFLYMEHTCKLDDSPCQLTSIARDCSEYTRIVDCCCHQQLASKWKANYLKSSASRTIPLHESIISTWNLLMAYINVAIN